MSSVLSFPELPTVERRQYGDAFWRSLFYFNVYRLAVAITLIVSVLAFGDSIPFGSYSRKIFLYGSIGYIVFSLLSFAAVIPRKPYFGVQLTVQICADIFFIVLLMHASGGIGSGLGLLLLASLAAVGLISRGRSTLFFAALATIAVLSEHTYQVVSQY